MKLEFVGEFEGRFGREKKCGDKSWGNGEA